MSVVLTAYLWLILAFVLAVIAWMIASIVLSSREHDLDFTRLRDQLDMLLQRGYDGSYLRLDHKLSGRSFQFRKYIHGKGDFGLELQCPSSDWLESTSRKVEAIAEDAGLLHRREPSKSTDEVKTLLVIDCGQDAAAAYDLAKAIWIGIFGLSLKTPYKPIADDWAQFYETIDGPDHLPPLQSLPPNERLKEQDARARKFDLPSVNTSLLGAVWVFGLLISGTGLPIAVLGSRGQEPDWSIQLSAIGFEGGVAGLAFFLVFVLSALGALCLKLPKPKRPKSRWERRVGWLGRTLIVGLPIVVILVWAGF